MPRCQPPAGGPSKKWMDAICIQTWHFRLLRNTSKKEASEASASGYYDGRNGGSCDCSQTMIALALSARVVMTHIRVYLARDASKSLILILSVSQFTFRLLEHPGVFGIEAGLGG